MEKKFTNFTFHMPTEIVFGKGAELQAGEYVKKYGGTKVMIVMDGGGFIKASGLFDRVAGSLTEAGIPYIELEGVQPNPNASLMLEGLERCKAEGVDFVLGVGGGSTMDTTKAIALGLANEGDVMDFFTHKRRPQVMGPCGAVSTIAASGSETSSSALIKDDREGGSGLKGGFNNRDLRMRFALMNPEVTFTVPAFQTACGAADMFSHTFDTYLTDEASYLADGYDEATMRTAVKYGPIALADPSNYEARAELMLNASFAHNDTTRIGRVGGAPVTHNLEEALGNLYHRTHGAGIALVMPACIQLALDKDETTVPRLAQLAVRVFGVEDDPCDQRAVAQEGIDRMRAWLKGMGLPQTIREYGNVESVSDEDIEKLLDWTKFHDGYFWGYGNGITREDVAEMFRNIA